MLALIKNKKDWKKHLKIWCNKAPDIVVNSEPEEYPCFVVTFLNRHDLGKFEMSNVFIYKHNAKELIKQKISKD